MGSKILFLLIFVAGYVRSDVYYKQLPIRGRYPLQPQGYYRAPMVPEQYKYAPTWIARGYGVQGEKSRNYYTGDKSDSDYYSGDVLRKTIHKAQDSGMKAGSGKGGSHAVSVDTKGSEDYARHTSGRGRQAAGKAASGKELEYGTTGNEAYDSFGKIEFKKGHSKSGFQKSYNKEESGKDSKFVDEDVKVGGEIFAKYYGDKYGHSEKEGYGEAVKGFGYDHTASGSGAAKSGLDSNGKHDIFYGEHGHKAGYDRGVSSSGAEEKGTYQDNSRNIGNTYGSTDQMEAVQQKPIHYF